MLVACGSEAVGEKISPETLSNPPAIRPKQLEAQKNAVNSLRPNGAALKDSRRSGIS
jgi:hypothetical protein